MSVPFLLLSPDIRLFADRRACFNNVKFSIYNSGICPVLYSEVLEN